MFLQTFLSLFIPKIKKTFEEFLDNKFQLGKTLINITKCTEYL